MQNTFKKRLYDNDFLQSKVGSSPTTGTKTKNLAAQGFFIFSYTYQRFFTPPYPPFLYAYAYKSMPYHTPYAKRKCKTNPRPLLRTGAFSHTIQ